MLPSRFNKFWKGRSRGKILGKDPPPPNADDAEALILVVGSDTEYKTEVAHALANDRGATEKLTTKAGVEIFTRASGELSPLPVVMNTVPLTTVERWRPVDIARMWVTQNSLRKLSGKLVFVVCVIATPDSNDQVYKQPDFKRNRLNWLRVLAHVFEDHKQEIMILVHSEDSTDEVTKVTLRDILKLGGFTRNENITFANLRKTVDLIPTVQAVLQQAAIRGIADAQTGRKDRSAMAPFPLPWVGPNASKKKRVGPWGPENVILFGRSGSGKSTLAKMLTLGRLDALSKSFHISSGIRGETRTINEGEGRGWHVIDTPGLGDPYDNEKGLRHWVTLTRKYVQLVRQTDGRLIYVWKKERLDNEDELLWEFFVDLVGAELIKNRTTVAVSGADENWLEWNVSYLKQCFVGCESFLAVDLPPVPHSDDAYEKDVQALRLESLKALEDALASLCPLDKMYRSTGVPRSPMPRARDSFTRRRNIRPPSGSAPSVAEDHHRPDDPIPPEHYGRGPIKAMALGVVSICVVHLREYEFRRRLEDKIGTPDSLVILYERERGQPVESHEASANDLDPDVEKRKRPSGVVLSAQDIRREIAKNNPGPGVELAKRASAIVSAEDFGREIEVGYEEGYFVSSKWLLNLEEHEKENLMSVLRRAGYSNTRQTCTTILFARIGNDGQNQVLYDGGPKSSLTVDKIVAPKEGDDLLDIGRQGLNSDKSATMADVCGSDNLAETSSSIDREIKTFDSDAISEEISPAAGEQRAQMWSKSFQAAIDSKGHRTFCVSTEWLSNLKDDEKTALEAGYEKIRETNTITWYEQIGGHTKNPTGEGTYDNDSSKSSSRNDIAGSAVKKPATSEDGGRTQNFDGEDYWRDSPSVETTKETRPRIQDRQSTCHPQLLSVSCLSSSQTAMDLSPRFGCNRKQFGGTIVKMPGTDRSRNISTTFEKPFQLPDVIAVGQRPQEVTLNLKARASTTLSCCVRLDHHPQKVRLEIHAISGDVKNEETEELDEMGNFFILRSFYTSVYGRVKYPTNTSDLINLNLEDVYIHNQERRVLANAQNSAGPSTPSADFVWLEMSPSHTNDWEPGLITLALSKFCKSCEKNERQRSNLRFPDSLYFRGRPVILEGDIEGFLPGSFIEFRIRYTLEVHYFRLLREIGPVASAKHVKKPISFDCYMEMSTEGN